MAIIQQYDIIIDCTDLFSVRYCINDACVLLEKALVFGAVFQYEGQVAVFNIGEKMSKEIYEISFQLFQIKKHILLAMKPEFWVPLLVLSAPCKH